MINLYYFTEENLKKWFRSNLESHKTNHGNSIVNITPRYLDFGIETIYINKILKEMATIYVTLLSQYK